MSRIFFLFLTFLTFAQFSFAADNPTYMIENVNVSVTGKSPSDARNMAVASARRDAFLILLTRLEMNINVADVVNNEEISDMVMSEQIEGEKIAGSTYSATFKIMFAKDFVDHILAQKNAPKAEEKVVENLLLVPIKTVKNQTFLWEEENDWNKAIARNVTAKTDANASQKFVIPEADIESISLINRDNITTLPYNGFAPLLTKYKAAAVYTLFFSYDEIENKVNINVFYMRKLQKKQFKLGFVNVDHLQYEPLLNKVASKTVDYLISSQKSESKAAASNIVKIQIPVTSLSNWLIIKNKIENSGFVNQVTVESISRDFAMISVNYVNTDSEIAEAFMRIGFSLDQKSENFYTLSIQ